MRPVLLALLLTGCAAAPPSQNPASVPQPAGKPPAAPVVARLPASVFLGNYPTKNRDIAQRCWAALPAEVRRASPPSFRLVTAAELKKLPGVGLQEGSGAYDTQNRVVYSRPDYQQMLGHELGHFIWYEGRDPKSGRAPLLTKEQLADWVAWNERNWRLVPQYCSDVPECNRRKPHESWAQAALVTWLPDGKPHPNYGRAAPAVAAKVRSYFPP